jgi:predicted secreted protein
MAGHSALGTLLGISTSGSSELSLTVIPTSWDYIGAVTNVGGPSLMVDTIDVTAHDSADAAREYVAGVIDGGDINIEGNLVDAASGQELTELIDTRETVCFCVKFPTTGTVADAYDTWLLAGAVVGFETQAPFDGKLGFTAGIKLSGKPFLTSTYTTA